MLVYLKRFFPTLITMSLILSPVANAKSRTPYSQDALKKVEKAYASFKDIASVKTKFGNKEFESYLKKHNIPGKSKLPSMVLKDGKFHFVEGMTVTLYLGNLSVVSYKGKEVEINSNVSFNEMMTKLESLTQTKTSTIWNLIMSDAYANPLALVGFAGVGLFIFYQIGKAAHDSTTPEEFLERVQDHYHDTRLACASANQDLSVNGWLDVYKKEQIEYLYNTLKSDYIKSCLTPPVEPKLNLMCNYMREIRDNCGKAISVNPVNTGSVNESDRSNLEKADLPSGEASSSQTNRASGQ